MVWDQLSVNKPHLVYIILGGFTALFMLCSSVIKERLYIGEATVATLCGIIFGPHAANLINPATWGNTDQITLEFSRIVLVVQCFAVGVELPRYYMEKHWRSVVLLLVPVMTFGWLVTSLFIWALLGSHLSWLDSLCCAACVTATDPVLASSVVGKGKFAKRVPKHLRDLLSAESGCNDGMAFPFIYLALYIIRYRPDAGTVALHWFCNGILYECIWGATYGVLVGYCARHAIRYAHEKDIIDRESFLVFYFVLALFCAGSGSLLGMDDLLVGFACGVGFSNDGWFLEKTEESHVSNVIDLLINLAFFVYFGTIIPWDLYNSAIIGTSPWRLVVIALLVLFFRRIPIMLALKPFIPDIKTWREALFAGHFGPIGVGALFVAILARGELETGSTTPLAVLPPPNFEHDNIIELIWPITTFLVITSIIVHGSSIAVFTLGQHINTLTLTMSYTQGNEDGNWMDRLPRITSRTKSSMARKVGDSIETTEEKLPEYPQAALSALPRNFLRRQREEDNPSRSSSYTSASKGKSWGVGGPISQSAIAPQQRRRNSPESSDFDRSGSETLGQQGEGSSTSVDGKSGHRPGEEDQEEIYREGDDTVFEDQDGNVLKVTNSKGKSDQERTEHEQKEARNLMDSAQIEHGISKQQDFHPEQRAKENTEKDLERQKRGPEAEAEYRSSRGMRRKMQTLKRRPTSEAQASKISRGGKSGPARAFRIGRTIIVEDEDGEVIKQYDIPVPEKDKLERKQSHTVPSKTRQGLNRMGTWLGVNQSQDEDGHGPSGTKPHAAHKQYVDDDDDHVRFTMNGNPQRLTKADFIKQVQALDPKTRAKVVNTSNASEAVKIESRANDVDSGAYSRREEAAGGQGLVAKAKGPAGDAVIEKVASHEDRPTGPDGLTLVDSNKQDIPFHSVSHDLKDFMVEDGHETAAQRRRRLAGQSDGADKDVPAALATHEEQDSDDDGTDRVPPAHKKLQQEGAPLARKVSHLATVETAAERRRREGALGVSKEESDSEEEGVSERGAAPEEGVPGAEATDSAGGHRGIRFADQPQREGLSVRWGRDLRR